MKKQLRTQCSNVHSQQLLSQLVIDEVQQQCYGKGQHTQKLCSKPH